MTARYLLDTNICIYIAKHHPPEVRCRFEQIPSDELVMSVITYGELLHGAEKSQMRERTLGVLQSLTETISVQALPIAAAAHYGEIRAVLERTGTPIGNNDLWIAAHARSEGLVVVTNNEREFQRVPGLKVENWVC